MEVELVVGRGWNVLVPFPLITSSTTWHLLPLRFSRQIFQEEAAASALSAPFWLANPAKYFLERKLFAALKKRILLTEKTASDLLNAHNKPMTLTTFETATTTTNQRFCTANFLFSFFLRCTKRGAGRSHYNNTGKNSLHHE